MRPVIPVSKFSLPNFLRTVGLSRVFTLSSIRSTSCTLKVWGVQSFPEGTLSSQCFMLDLSLGIMWPLQWLEYKVLPMLVLHSLIKLTGVLPVTNPLLTIPKCLTDNDYFRDTEIFSWLFCEWWKTWCLTWNYTMGQVTWDETPTPVLSILHKHKLRQCCSKQRAQSSFPAWHQLSCPFLLHLPLAPQALSSSRIPIQEAHIASLPLIFSRLSIDLLVSAQRKSLEAYFAAFSYHCLLHILGTGYQRFCDALTVWVEERSGTRQNLCFDPEWAKDNLLKSLDLLCQRQHRW